MSALRRKLDANGSPARTSPAGDDDAHDPCAPRPLASASRSPHMCCCSPRRKSSIWLHGVRRPVTSTTASRAKVQPRAARQRQQVEPARQDVLAKLARRQPRSPSPRAPPASPQRTDAPGRDSAASDRGALIQVLHGASAMRIAFDALAGDEPDGRLRRLREAMRRRCTRRLDHCSVLMAAAPACAIPVRHAVAAAASCRLASAAVGRDTTGLRGCPDWPVVMLRGRSGGVAEVGSEALGGAEGARGRLHGRRIAADHARARANRLHPAASPRSGLAESSGMRELHRMRLAVAPRGEVGRRMRRGQATIDGGCRARSFQFANPGGSQRAGVCSNKLSSTKPCSAQT